MAVDMFVNEKYYLFFILAEHNGKHYYSSFQFLMNKFNVYKYLYNEY